MDNIKVQGARTHNLKNISLSIPRDKLVVITGLSGSGKSSLAFDTLYAEGQRRYVESLSAYARQFLSLMEKPDVDAIEGLSPAISIEQKSRSHNPRSTVGTMTEIYDYLRLLFARAGEPRCPSHGVSLAVQTVSQMVDQVLTLPEQRRLLLLAPVVRQRKGEHSQLIADLLCQGYNRIRVDGQLYPITEVPPLVPGKTHSIEVVVDRFRPHLELKQRLAESFETALVLSDGLAWIADMDDDQFSKLLFSAHFSCPDCGYTLSELEPRLFSFNNPAGACRVCDGLGVQQRFAVEQVVANPELSLAAGAIRGWDRRNHFYFQLLTQLANDYQFDINLPFNQLPAAINQLILYGSSAVTSSLCHHLGLANNKQRPLRFFEGVIPTMERRYHETESLAVRENLAQYLKQQRCESCQGTRLQEGARHVFLSDTTLPQMVQMSIGELLSFFQRLNLSGQRAEIANKILITVSDRLHFLVQVGLDYLTLGRAADSLSGGETQRIRLASQIGSGLVGVMYVLDEPSIGLHQRDNARLLEALFRLRDLGNTVIVVEHDEEAIRVADHVIDIGPGAGLQGGELVAQGSVAEIIAVPESLTGQFLSGERSIVIPKQRVAADPQKIISLRGASGHNLQRVTLNLPVGLLSCITGVSGSGKSTLIGRTLLPLVQQRLKQAMDSQPAPYEAIEGLQQIDSVIAIDQSPIGRTPRSNPATYTGLLTPIRELFAGVPEARTRGYSPGRFSFNVKGGRCEACQGDGVIRVEMHFLPDIYVACDQCQGKRYNRETLEITYKGYTIHQILEMTVSQAYDFFAAIPVLIRRLQTLIDVGLSYLSLGQAATTLSGGEAQRLKLSRELAKRASGQTLYILDEPTTGLHFADIQQLLAVLHRLRDQGNTIVVIEHNLDVIKTADWIVDLGPEGGSGGGQIVVAGTPERVAEISHSHTGRFLKPLLMA
ncbi:MAG: excinuclease ABC subunit UvrA [Candidatus Symbiodolus clandestinus]